MCLSEIDAPTRGRNAHGVQRLASLRSFRSTKADLVALVTRSIPFQGLTLQPRSLKILWNPNLVYVEGPTPADVILPRFNQYSSLLTHDARCQEQAIFKNQHGVSIMPITCLLSYPETLRPARHRIPWSPCLEAARGDSEDLRT